jgi:hypothetical protein
LAVRSTSCLTGRTAHSQQTQFERSTAEIFRLFSSSKISDIHIYSLIHQNIHRKKLLSVPSNGVLCNSHPLLLFSSTSPVPTIKLFTSLFSFFSIFAIKVQWSKTLFNSSSFGFRYSFFACFVYMFYNDLFFISFIFFVIFLKSERICDCL